ncbi:hypothetical protein ACFVXH_12480 [Kitasatospora sp. NPDC058184]|uniref:hypothetical protein n=1 Tax=unclassified Kitasatospora TaxID=2633591 RepID=UPI000ADED604|nr:hypothetical protein [Kitasatospora sp. MY 5-36]
MKPFSVQRVGVILATVLGLGLIFAAQPASATTRDDGVITGVSASVDKKTAAPGDELTLTLSLTNTESAPITFAYEWIGPSFPSNQLTGAFTFTGCGGDQVDCVFGGNSVNFHPTVPIAPGATRTVTATVRITSTPPWTGSYTLNWAPYVYAEYGYPVVKTRSGPFLDGMPGLQTVIS